MVFIGGEKKRQICHKLQCILIRFLDDGPSKHRAEL